MSERRVALKVDCDTYEGTRDGVPRLIELFASRGIRASFFFTLGPDRSGVAVRRVFTRKGFLAKMIRSRAGSLYGFRTALYGTLLPAPMIGQRCAGPMRAAAQAGHPTGVHGWDHVGWHDRLDRMSLEEIRGEYGHAHAEYLRIIGLPARASAAPGWTANARSLEVQEERSLLYTSDTRGGSPFFPQAGGRTFRTLEIPTTLPTLDETLAWPALRSDEDQRAFYRRAVQGRSKAALFGGILDDWLSDGVAFPLLTELAREALEHHDRVPERPISKTTLPGRAGFVTTGWPAPASG